VVGANRMRFFARQIERILHSTIASLEGGDDE
jgi:hypothetical protein